MQIGALASKSSKGVVLIQVSKTKLRNNAITSCCSWKISNADFVDYLDLLCEGT